MTVETKSDPIFNGRPALGEWRWVLLLIAGFFGLNLASYNLYPVVWCDEVWFSEPAVNLVQHGIFHSTAWLFEPPNTFPTVNCPLYLTALVPWVKVFGAAVMAVRSFNYALMAAAAFLVWIITWRFDLVKSARARFLLLVILQTGYGMSFAFRCSRPDILGMICLLLLTLGFTIHDRRAKELCLFALAAVAVWIGFQVAMFAGVAACLAWILFRRPRIQEIVVMALGEAIGILSLLQFYSWKGALSYFIVSIRGNLGFRYVPLTHLSFAQKVFRVVTQSGSSFIDDFSTDFLLLGAFVLLAVGWRKMSTLRRNLLIFAIVLTFGVPLLFDIVGHWGFYYSYMRFVPLTVAWFSAWSEIKDWLLERACWPRLAATTLMVLAIMTGLPMRLGFSLVCCDLTPRRQIQNVVSSALSAADVVMTDHDALFEAKRAANVVYDTYYSSDFMFMPLPGSQKLTPSEKKSINVLIIRPERFREFSSFFGGEWKAITEPFGDRQDCSRFARLPIIGRRLASYAAQPQTERYQLQIFRRSPEPARALMPMRAPTPLPQTGK